MQSILFVRRVVFIVFFFIFLSKSFAQEVKRPNILVFFVDDLGWLDLSEPFYKEITPINERFHTPNVKELALASVKFTNAYATPVCTPSRVSYLTGLNAAQHRVTSWTSPDSLKPTDLDDEDLQPPNWNYIGLSAEDGVNNSVFVNTFPKILQSNGYHTIHVGKAHWGAAGTSGANPLNLGFMINVAGHSAGSPQSYYGEDNYGNQAGKAKIQAVPGLMEYYGSSVFLTEALTREAMKALREPIRRNEPFFLNLSHYGVHTPIQKDLRFVNKYLQMGLSEKEAAYSSLVEGVDKSLGDIISFLKENKVYENTVIVFVSDNGGLSLGSARGGLDHSHNKPLRAGKGSVYEGGIRVPLLIKGVSSRRGVISQAPVIMEDLYPTILEMAGVSVADSGNIIDGLSLVSLLKGEEEEAWASRSLVWHMPNKWISQDHLGFGFRTAMRQGDYKLIYNMKERELELYNLRMDIEEANNLAQEQHDLVKRMAILLSDKLRIWKAQLPIDKKTGKSVPYPDEI